MLETRVKPVRALARGLDVLLELQRVRAASLHELHESLGLPKATLLRMLVTLASRGLVWQRLADGAYMPHHPGGGAPDTHGARIAEVASPHLETLSRIVAWPSVIAIPRLDHLEIVETNSRLLRLDAAQLGPVGAKLSYIHTATGRAYLSACGEEERADIIARLRPRANAGEGEALLARIVDETLTRGFAQREPLHPWPDRSRQAVRADGRRSMAVAVHVAGRPVAGINITWPGRRATYEEVSGRHLNTLQATAALIGAELSGA